MPNKDDCLKAVRGFRARSGIEAPDENIIATLHLMNAHGMDQNGALDQSSRAHHDNGIDAWYYSVDTKELFVYQSKLSDSKSIVAKGFSDLGRACEWLQQVVVDGQVERVPSTNHCLFNLFTALSGVRGDIQKVHFRLISPLNPNLLEDCADFEECESTITRSGLNTFLRNRAGGRITLRSLEYDIDRSVPSEIKTYIVERIPNTRLALRKNAHLDLAYLNLHSLVLLYRERGDVLFDKNVRLSLVGNKEARDRLVHPMEATLEGIVTGKLSPAIFAFYHIGVTLAASASDVEDERAISLEAPSVINGCQTIAIASEYLRKLERQNTLGAIERFKDIKIIAKVVVGTTSDELKEITNSNNRQNPIENWQLFSNEPVHIEIEAALKDIGVFYERQKGRYESVMKNADNAKHYGPTNGTFVRVTDLAQLIALARRNIAWAAKPSEVFVDKESHDKCFDRYVARNPRDIIFVWNLYKALRRGLNKYLDLPTHVNSAAPAVFKKQTVRAHTYSLALLHFYQSPNRKDVRAGHSSVLSKKANATLVDEAQKVFYQRTVTRIRDWYVQQSKEFEVEVSKKKLDEFFLVTLAGEIGVDHEGACPFSATAIDWTKYS